jgi:hypothetical protein
MHGLDYRELAVEMVRMIARESAMRIAVAA